MTKLSRNVETMHQSEQIECQVTAANNDPETLQSSQSKCRELGVYRQRSPVFYTLSVFGINLHRQVEYPFYKSSVASCGWYVYNTIILPFLLANICRLKVVYQHKNTTELHRIFNIQNTLWIAQNVGHYTVFYV